MNIISLRKLALLFLILPFIGEPDNLMAQELWGVTQYGGVYNSGTIYKTDIDGTNHSVRYSFVNQYGNDPIGNDLYKASNGKLYGMTTKGGSYPSDEGVIFELNTSTGKYGTLFEFGGANGEFPSGGLVQASNGKFYGMTPFGGANSKGVLFEFDPNTFEYIVKVDFSGTTNGSEPKGGLIEASNGKLYGFTERGGTNNMGTLFEFDPSTGALLKKIDFDDALGHRPMGDLLEAGNGKLYGLCAVGAIGFPLGSLIEYDISTGIAVMKYDFAAALPLGSLIEASNGLLYGVTSAGGFNGDGQLFEYDYTSSILTMKSAFGSTSTGRIPMGRLVEAGNGNLYGLTSQGGNGGQDDGVLFEYNISSNTLSAKKVFGIGGIAATRSEGSLTVGSNGFLYGLSPIDVGTPATIGGHLFEYDPALDAFAEVITFTNSSIGHNPVSNLVEDSAGILYGALRGGGQYYLGGIFSFNAETDVYTHKLDISYNLDGFTSGAGMSDFISYLTAHSNGSIYGSVKQGPNHSFFEYVPSANTLTKKGSISGGKYIEAANGNLYALIADTAIYEYNVGSGITSVKKTFSSVTSGLAYDVINDQFKGFSWAAGGLSDLWVYDPTADAYAVLIASTNCAICNAADDILLTEIGTYVGIFSGNPAIGDSGTFFNYDPIADFFSSNTLSLTEGTIPSGKLMESTKDRIFGSTKMGGTSNKGTIYKVRRTSNVTFDVMHNFNGLNGHQPNGNEGYTGLTEICGIFPYLQPQSETVCSIDPEVLVLTLAARATNATSYQWTRNGVAIQYATNKNYEVDRTMSNNGAVYQCEFINSCGSVFSDPAVVTIFTLDTGYVVDSICRGVAHTFPDGTTAAVDTVQTSKLITSPQVYHLGYQCDSFIVTTLIEKGISYFSNEMVYLPDGDTSYFPDGTMATESSIHVSYYTTADGCDSNTTTTRTIPTNPELWGLTSKGGGPDLGTVFKLQTDSNNFSMVHPIQGSPGGNAYFNGIMEASNGKYYGTVKYGGSDLHGVLFEYDPVTNIYLVKIHFNDDQMFVRNGIYPVGKLLEENGVLFGVTEAGGDNGKGTIYGFDLSTEVYTKYVNFTGTNGEKPNGGLAKFNTGHLYGVTEIGGGNSLGVAYKYWPLSATVTVITSFDGTTTGRKPTGPLVEGSDGDLYGTCSYGGTSNWGTFYQLVNGNGFQKIVDFDYTNGRYPVGGLIEGIDSLIYGVAVDGGSNGGGVLFSYQPGCVSQFCISQRYGFSSFNEESPIEITQGADGVIYGVTWEGGPSDEGAIFSIDPAVPFSYQKLHDFTYVNGQPSGVIEIDSSIYGLTYTGGKYNSGVLFEFNIGDSTYNENINLDMYDQGNGPEGSLLQASNGKFYGVTRYGGSNFKGVVFEVDYTTGAYTKKAEFDDFKGNYPKGTLSEAADGKLYGVTSEGGGGINGAIFSYDIINDVLVKHTNMSYGFSSPNDLVLGKDSIFYMTTKLGGSYNEGTLRKYDPRVISNQSGIVTTFQSSVNGSNPSGRLVMADNGKLYGVTENGGSNGDGVVFEYNPVTELFFKKIDLDEAVHGAHPLAGLIQGSDGKLYGTTTTGGAYNQGTVFCYDYIYNTLTKRANFSGPQQGELYQASNNKMYGVNSQGNGALFEFDLVADTIIWLHTFNITEGQYPIYTALIEPCPPITISQQPMAATICEGDSIMFKVEQTGALKLQWYKDGVKLSGEIFDSLILEGVSLSDSGNYTCEVGSFCRELVTTAAFLTIAPLFDSLETIQVCNGNPYTFADGTVLSVDTTYISYFTSIDGCDSIFTTTLKVGPFTYYDTVSICDGQVYTFPDGSTDSANIVQTSTLTDAGGCDSIILTTLTIDPLYMVNEIGYSCPGSPYVFPDGYTSSVDTVHTSYLTSSLGCDSVVYTTLDARPDYLVLDTGWVCPGDNYTFHDGVVVNNISSTFSHTSNFTSQFGCDSTFITTINLYPIYNLTDTAVVDSNLNFVFHDGTLITNVIANTSHSSILSSSFGCDSIITTSLFVNQIYNITIYDTICPGDSYTYPDSILEINITASTIHVSYLQSLTLSDSIVTTDLHVSTTCPEVSDVIKIDGEWKFNGDVYVIAKGSTSNTIYVGGDFTSVNMSRGFGMVVSPISALPKPQFPEPNIGVRTSIPDGDGGWYIAGYFSTVGGVPRNRIAHIDKNGNVTAFNPNANNNVYTLAKVGNIIYAGGTFTSVGGQTRNRIAALDSATGLATAWNPNASSQVNEIKVMGDTLMVAGAFSTIGGQSVYALAMLDLTSGNAHAWSVPSINSMVNSFDIIGDTVYLGGFFTSVDGQSRNRVAAAEINTGNLAAWNPNANGTVNIVRRSIDGSSVFVGGTFGNVDGQVRQRLVEVDLMGNATSWDPSPNNEVIDISTNGNLVYFAGKFTSVGGVPQPYVAAVDKTTGALNDWNPILGGECRSVKINENAIYLGGIFSYSNVYARDRLVAFDRTSGALLDWSPNPAQSVYALAVKDTLVYVGGMFGSIGGQVRTRIAAVSTISGLATSWNPSANNPVYALEIDNNVLYVGGMFTTLDGQARTRLGAYDLTTGTLTSFNPGVGATVYDIESADTSIYIAGAFLNAGGQTRNRIAEIGMLSGAATSWNPNANSDVKDILLIDTTIYAGGSFSSIGGQANSRGAAISTLSGLSIGWNPGAGNTINSLAHKGKTLFIGGLFTSAGGQPRNRIAALDKNTALSTPWDPDANGEVHTMLVVGNYLYVGGAFTSIADDNFVGRYARFKLGDVLGTIDNIAICMGDSVSVQNLNLTTNDLTITATSSNQSLLPNGNISILGSGANQSISLNPVPGQSGDVLITVKSIDSALEEDSTVFSFSVNSLAVTATMVNNISCNNANDAQIITSVSGSSSLLEYSLDNSSFVPSGVFSSLTAGNYTIYVRDLVGCTDSSGVLTVINPAPINVSSILDNDISCFSLNDAQITISGNGGSGQLNYSLDNITYGTDSVFSGLSAGTYEAYIKDNSGCIDSTGMSITITNPPALSISSVMDNDISCNNVNDGQITATGSGGTGALTYSLDGITFSSNPVFTGLTDGTYLTYIKDNSGCMDSTGSTLTVTNPPALSISASLDNNIICQDGNDAQISAMGTGGLGTLSYSINNGPFSGATSYPALSAGSYTIYVKDSMACLDSSTSITVVNPDTLIVNSTVDIPVSCNSASDAQLSASTTGGAGGYNYLWSNSETTYSIDSLSSGTYSVTVVDANGCSDSSSTVLVNPSVLTVTATVDSNASCNGISDGGGTVVANGGSGSYIYSWSNGATDSSATDLAAGAYSVTVTDATSCSDISSILITEPPQILASVMVDSNATCNGSLNGGATGSGSGGTGSYTYAWSNSATTASISGISAGVYIITVTDSIGCSNTALGTITEPAAITSTSTVTICAGDSMLISGIWQSAAANYNDTSVATNGCDSIAITTLAVTPIYSATNSVVICTGDSLLVGGGWQTTGGTYYDSLLASSGCDSVIITSLTVSTSITANQAPVSACDSVQVNSNWYTSSQTVSDFFAGGSTGGCDSTSVTVVTISSSVIANQAPVTSCDSVQVNGNWYSNSQTVTDLFAGGAASGCDSTSITVVTISGAVVTNQTPITTCDSAQVNGNWYTSSQTVTDFYSGGSSSGCDSTSITAVTITSMIIANQTPVTSCDSVQVNGNWYSSSQTVTDIYLGGSSSGCDSTSITVVTISTAVTTNQAPVTSCDSIQVNGNWYTSSQTVTDIYVGGSSSGCDSTSITVVTIDGSTVGSETTSACNSYTWAADNSTYTSGGTYTATLTNADGCDSVVTLSLTINTVDVSVTQAGTTLSATASGASYQWLDCTGGYTPIPSEIGQTYTATVDGDYAVVVTNNGCTDTSACLTVSTVGLSENAIDAVIALYPNPTTGNVTIDMGYIPVNGLITLTDLAGKVIYSIKDVNDQVVVLPTSTLSRGVYLVRIQGKEQKVIKLIKE